MSSTATQAATTTTELELAEVSSHVHIQPNKSKSQPQLRSGGHFNDGEGQVLGSSSIGPSLALPDAVSSGPPEEPAYQGEVWNTPRINIFRTFSCFFSLLAMGLNDAAYGALIPYLESYFDLSYTVVSLIFLAPFVGYTAAALSNASIHHRFGQRGVAVAAPSCRVVAYLVLSFHPPYPVLVVMYLFVGFGIGLADAGWNAYIGDMQHANQLLGMLHGFYGLGATLSPLIAASMVDKGGLGWWTFYYFMTAIAITELVTSLASFWAMSGAAFRRTLDAASGAAGAGTGGNRLKQALLRQPGARITWLCALFFLGYVGVEVSLGGWIVEFMITVRHRAKFPSSITATGFWLGLTIGRVVLGFVTPRLGETLAIAIYLPVAMTFELLFWLVPQFYVSAVAVALQGFFLGPLFPAGIVAMTKLLPKRLHVTSIGFAAAFGGCGAAIFPFAVGAIAQKKGVQVLQPIVLAMMAAIWLLWLCLPRVGKKRD